MNHLVRAILLISFFLPTMASASTLYLCEMDGRGHLTCCCGQEGCNDTDADCSCCERQVLQIPAQRVARDHQSEPEPSLMEGTPARPSTTPPAVTASASSTVPPRGAPDLLLFLCTLRI